MEPSEREVGLEYVRDSPMFRQQLQVFESSFSGIDKFANNLRDAVNTFGLTLKAMSAAQRTLAYALAGKNAEGSSIEGVSGSRCLFTNALPALKDLSKTVHEVASALQDSASIEEVVRHKIEDSGGILSQLQELENLYSEAKGMAVPGDGSAHSTDQPNESHITRVERLYRDYEGALDRSLQSREPPSREQEAALVLARRDYEMARFDMVARLNTLDSRKKLLLSELAVDTRAALLGLHSSSAAVFTGQDSHLDTVAGALPSARQALEGEEDFFESVRFRLEGELCGSAPPPRAPSGALSPVQPRRHAGMSMYTTPIFTEVLRSSTQKASYEERRHAHDEGVFKQGYLFTLPGMFSFARRRRVWHRLYGTKLYTVSDPRKDLPSCESTLVCDVSGAEVTARVPQSSRDMPYIFVISTAAGAQVQLQAECQDELVAWIAAVKRCGSRLRGSADPRLKGRDARTSINANVPLSTSPVSSPATSTESGATGVPGPGQGAETAAAAAELPTEMVCRGRAALLLRDVVLQSPVCAECSAGPVTWISTSIGVTLCETCADAHRRLTWSVSKLKSIRLDDFREWQLDMIASTLGNDVARTVWECDIPKGWEKPHPKSPSETKREFVLAKYKWLAFVDEVRVRGEAHLAQGITESARDGSVRDIMWWISHAADVNAVSASSGGNSAQEMLTDATPLHYAVSGNHVHAAAFLLLNGANVYAKDGMGRTAVEYAGMVSGGTKELISAMVDDIGRGDY